MKKYNPKEIEKKWQKYWEDNNTFKVTEDDKKEKFYPLVEFPYPSGEGLHVGHPRPFTAMDVVARKKRMEGKNVLYPMGFDAFGLPTENYAIKTGRPPAEVTKENIANFTRQLKMLGYSFDWDRVVDTTDPKYYKWTQWIFLQLFKHGLAYKKNMPINWCLSCKTGLANEEVVEGKCERCSGEVEKRDKEQWMLAITKYADKLLQGLEEVDYINRAKVQQQNWIGRSEGAQVTFNIKDSKQKLEVFTTRPDTLFGATYMVISPEHDLIMESKEKIENFKEVNKYTKEAKLKSDLERTELQKEKTGVELKGIKVINPVNNEEIPVFVADYVLSSYGTGAIMAVPAHDQRDWEFAKKFDLKIHVVVLPLGGSTTAGNEDSQIKEEEVNKILSKKSFGEFGYCINSDFLSGLKTDQAKEKMIKWLEEKKVGKKEINYKLRDWIFSRQRYWGEPIPLVHCEKCDWQPIPEDELPLELPRVEKYEPTDTGESPLSQVEDWVKTTCPKCGGSARRETDTMPNWAGSSWYFLRYCDPNNDKELANVDKLKYWGPIDWYNGGMEHTVLHLLYSRFWNQFLYDIGVVPFKEPYKKRTSHGMILAEDGEKMSKSRGNVINPDEMVEKFGTDAFRTYVMFMGPFDQAVSWDTNGLVGVKRFLDKVWNLQEKMDKKFKYETESRENQERDRMIHQQIRLVSGDIEKMKFNTAIADLMLWSNTLNQRESITLEEYKTLILLLSPFAPHMCEELWKENELGNKESITFESWPDPNLKKAKSRFVEVVVQVNGKLRGQLEDIEESVTQEEIERRARELEKVKKWLDGKEPKKVIYVKGKLVNFVI